MLLAQIKRANDFYGGATFVGNDYYHSTLHGKLPRGKLLCKDIIVGVNGETVFDVNEERPSCSFDSVIDRMRSTGPGNALVLDVMRLSSQPIPRRIRVTKALPKYVGSSSNVIFTQELLERIRDKVIGDACGIKSAAASTSELTIDAKEVPSDQFSTTLTVSGWSDLVESTKSIITDVVHSHVICQKQNAMLRSNDNVELDLRLDPGRKMGLNLDDFGHTYLPRMRRLTRGVWFKVQSGEQMSSILGRAIDLGGVLLKIGDRTVDSIDDATNAWTSLRDGPEVTVTICIHKSADTTSVSRSHLVREPRRRGGGAYRGPLHVPAASTSNLSTKPSGASSTKRKRKLSDGDDSCEERKRKASASTDGNGNGRDGSEAPVSNISVNVNEYQKFRAKMSRVFDVEFKAHGFQKSAVIKSAWSLHKSLLGDTCGDNCSCCPSRLRDICANVVKEHLEKKKQEEGSQWMNPLKLRPDEFPIGFISRFVPKFISRVEKEMPDSNTADVLDMLIQMWGKHKKASCSTSCTCQDDWESIFKPKVVLATMEASRNVPSNSTGVSSSKSRPPMVVRQSSSQGSSIAGALNAQEVFGRSRSPSPSSETNLNLIPKKVTTGNGGGTSTSISTSISRASKGTSKSATDMKPTALSNSLLPESVEKPFIVTFDTSRLNKTPLGIFFITDRRRRSDGDGTACKVASICPYITGKRQNAKIKVGSIVVGTAPNYSTSKKPPAMERLSCHKSLKERYDAACRDKTIASFNVWFINSDVLPSAVTNSVAAGKRDWSTSGEWLGRSKVAGWAGGAPTKAPAGSSDNKSRNKGNSKTAAEDNGEDTAKKPADNTSTAMDRDSSSDTESSPLTPSTTSSTTSSNNPTTKKKPLGRTGSLLLHPDRERKVGRKVSFCKNGHKTREYVIGSSVTGKIVEESDFDRTKSVASSAHQKSASSIDAVVDSAHETSASPTKGATLDMDVPINVRRSKKLLEAIWDGDYRDVLRLLKEGAPVTMRDKNNLAPYDHVKKKIVALESQLREASSADKPLLQESLTDFKRKSILLKIYIHVEHNISLLWAIDDWQNIQIAVDSINGLSLSPEGRQHPSSGYVFCVMVLENR